VTAAADDRLISRPRTNPSAVAPLPLTARALTPDSDGSGQVEPLGPGWTAVTVVIGVMAALIALGGMILSFRAVSHEMIPAFGQRWAWLVPIVVDLTIFVFSGVDLVLARLDMSHPLARWTVYGATGGTVWLNYSAGGSAAGRVAHVLMPSIWVVFIELMRHVVRRQTNLATGTHREPIPATRWLLSPWPTLKLWRRMVLWRVNSYPRALEQEKMRLGAVATAREMHGRLWRLRISPLTKLQINLGEVGAHDLRPASAPMPAPVHTQVTAPAPVWDPAQAARAEAVEAAEAAEATMNGHGGAGPAGGRVAAAQAAPEAPASVMVPVPVAVLEPELEPEPAMAAQAANGAAAAAAAANGTSGPSHAAPGPLAANGSRPAPGRPTGIAGGERRAPQHGPTGPTGLAGPSGPIPGVAAAGAAAAHAARTLPPVPTSIPVAAPVGAGTVGPLPGQRPAALADAPHVEFQAPPPMPPLPRRSTRESELLTAAREVERWRGLPSATRISRELGIGMPLATSLANALRDEDGPGPDDVAP